MLLGPERLPIETGREGHPYDRRMERTEYETTKRLLQIELLKAQAWIRSTRPEAGDPVRGSRCRYPDKDHELVGAPDPLIVGPPTVVAADAGEDR